MQRFATHMHSKKLTHTPNKLTRKHTFTHTNTHTCAYTSSSTLKRLLIEPDTGILGCLGCLVVHFISACRHTKGQRCLAEPESSGHRKNDLSNQHFLLQLPLLLTLPFPSRCERTQQGRSLDQEDIFHLKVQQCLPIQPEEG